MSARAFRSARRKADGPARPTAALSAICPTWVATLSVPGARAHAVGGRGQARPGRETGAEKKKREKPRRAFFSIARPLLRRPPRTFMNSPPMSTAMMGPAAAGRVARAARTRRRAVARVGDRMLLC